RPTCSPASRTAPAKLCCAKRWCSPTTTRTIWASSCCCAACSAPGRKTSTRSPGRRPLSLQPHFLEERTPPRLHSEPALDPRQHQPLPRARHAHVQETPRFLDLRLSILGRLPIARDLVVLDSHDIDPRELQALGRVQGEQVDAIG